MPYATNHDLPDAVKLHLPQHGQDIFREAFNHAHEEYKDPQKRHGPKDSLEEVCMRVAWAAVKEKYAKGAHDKWHEKK